MSALNTAFYAKNVPAWERIVRIVVSSAVIVFALFAHTLMPPWTWIVAASAAGFAVTGLVGFCPACAMVGRRIDKGTP